MIPGTEGVIPGSERLIIFQDLTLIDNCPKIYREWFFLNLSEKYVFQSSPTSFNFF